jgi:hypothetical protein
LIYEQYQCRIRNQDTFDYKYASNRITEDVVMLDYVPCIWIMMLKTRSIDESPSPVLRPLLVRIGEYRTLAQRQCFQKF